MQIPGTNVHIIQNVVLLKFQTAFRFLEKWHGQAAAQVQQVYVNTLKEFYADAFDRYWHGLLKLEQRLVRKQDVVFLSNVSQNEHEQVLKFSLSTRSRPTIDQDQDVIVLHLASKQSTTFHPEEIMRSFLVTLMDNASSEFYFVDQFFCAHQQDDDVKHVFAQIFGSIFQTCLNAQRRSFEDNFDALSVLLCIRITKLATTEMKRRQIPILDDYLKAIQTLLWTRFDKLMERHVSSSKRVQPEALMATRKGTAHFLTLKYATFVGSLLAFNHDLDSPVFTACLSKLRDEYIQLLRAMSTFVKVGSVFLINNVEEVLHIFVRSLYSMSRV
jgi:hypothetical protein